MKINIQVKPNSKKGPLINETQGGLIVYIREPAVDGKANEALIKLLAKHYKVPKSQIKIIKGLNSRHKTLDF